MREHTDYLYICLVAKLPFKKFFTTPVHTMTYKIHLHIEKLPENVWLATSDDVQGLVAQGRSLSETLEIARDVARKLLEAQAEFSAIEHISEDEAFDMPLVLEV